VAKSVDVSLSTFSVTKAHTKLAYNINLAHFIRPILQEINVIVIGIMYDDDI